jgi:RimJ/RimL family protein N-acetyltransferase
MRDNWAVCVTTSRLLLLPYRRRFVATYHEWMADPHLLESTSSERLTEAEELAAQAAWVADPQKCTFIVFDRALHCAGGELCAHAGGMVGDVNLFLLDGAPVAEDYFGGAPAAGGAAEVMVMIAEPAFRRRGYAGEAVRALLRYGAEVLGLRRFVAKVSVGNAPSLGLFAKLGFVEAKRVPAFGEVHLAWEWSDGGALEGWELLPCPAGAEEGGAREMENNLV